MGLTDYTVVDNNGLPVQQNQYNETSWNNVFVQAMEIPFLALFTLECVLKIISMGACKYLYDNWNKLVSVVLASLRCCDPPLTPHLVQDFIVVTTGIIDQMITSGGGSVLRLLRVLRPLRSSNRIKSIKTITSTIIKSLYPMQHVLLLMAFFSVLASIIALHLFGINGAVGALCRKTPFPMKDVSLPNGTTLSERCSPEDNAHWKDRVLPAGCYWSPIVDDRSTYCDIGFGGANTCESCYLVRGEQMRFDELKWGFVDFKNFFSTWTTLWITATLEGWSDTMMLVSDAFQPQVACTYFIVYVVFAEYVVRNLFITTILVQYDRCIDERDSWTARQIFHELDIHNTQSLRTTFVCSVIARNIITVEEVSAVFGSANYPVLDLTEADFIHLYLAKLRGLEKCNGTILCENHEVFTATTIITTAIITTTTTTTTATITTIITTTTTTTTTIITTTTTTTTPPPPPPSLPPSSPPLLH
jgi:hypothetical protein